MMLEILKFVISLGVAIFAIWLVNRRCMQFLRGEHRRNSSHISSNDLEARMARKKAGLDSKQTK